MALVTIPAEDRRLQSDDEIRSFLQPFGIWFERWDVTARITPESTNEQILSAYKPEIDTLKERGGYTTADVINVNPETPGLDAMLARFSKEHTHSEDEIRFTVEGGGVFHIHPDNGPVFAIQVEAGDMINVPAGTRHWFDLCNDRRIRCIRLFLDPAGWAPHYIDNGVHEGYQPLCWGPRYVTPSERIPTAVKL